MKVTVPMAIDLVAGLNDNFEKESTGSTYPLVIHIMPTSGGSHFKISFLGEDLYHSMDDDPDDPPTLESITKEVLEELKSIKTFLDHIVKH
jgi:hypothetical protein